MSGKLDQSLDEILSTQRRGNQRGGRAGRRVSQPGRAAAVAAPVGGVRKTRRGTGNGKAAPTGPALGGGRDSKIVVSNLPKDVNEAQIKEYFANAVGPIRKAEISYGPNGQSRGIANITFGRADGAALALKSLNGLLVDGKPMKVEVLVDATRAAGLPAPKGLSERIVQPKSHQKQQPKSAANTKPAADSANGAGRGKGRKPRGGRNARPAKKTAEELDSEMADYFDAGAAAAVGAPNGAAPATAGDAMDDEIL